MSVKNFYAVAEGEGLCIPAITTSWAIAGPMVRGPSNNLHCGFDDFKQAVNFLAGEGKTYFFFHQGSADGPRPPRQHKTKYYAVANGRQPGIYTDYKNEVKPLVDGYPGSCHRVFMSREDAELFLENHDQTTTRILQDAAETSTDSDESQSSDVGEDALVAAMNTMVLADSD